MSGDARGLTIFETKASSDRPAVESAFALTGLNTSNFGHWVFEYMFQLWAWMQRPTIDGLCLIVDARMPAQFREMIDLFTGGRQPVVVLGPGESVRVRRLWACSKIAYWPGGERPERWPMKEFELSDTDALARLIGTLQPRLEALAGQGYPQRIYLTRGDDQSRPLTNRRAVEDLFRSKGFAILNFNGLPYLEHVRHLRAASTVITEAGSTIYGLLMCCPGTRLGEIADENPTEYEWCAGMFKSLGLDLLLFPCRTEPAGPDVAGGLQMTADLGLLESYIEDRTR
jgi:capsular polysaccharide biosynthesis protein